MPKRLSRYTYMHLVAISQPINMGRITITLDNDLDKKLRQTVALTLGFKKGNLQIAVEEALKEWIKGQAHAREFLKEMRAREWLKGMK